MKKRKYLIPIINFLEKFGNFNIDELKRQAERNFIRIRAGKYIFNFIYSNGGWRLISINN